MKLNLGGGDIEIPGYVNIDHKFGLEVYPLEIPDNSVDEIRASHILEHFSYRISLLVIENWVSKLKLGGLIQISVPDFRWIVDHYINCNQVYFQGILFGGHVTKDDYHMVAFDEQLLTTLMTAAGLADIKRWTSEVEDCAQFELSLNLQGIKN